MTTAGRSRLLLLVLGIAAVTLWSLPAHAQTYTVLHRFQGSEGWRPEAGVIADPAGNIYGTTYAGGTSGTGTVYQLNKSGLTILYSFGEYTADGEYPYAGVIRDAAGNLFGTTYSGGVGVVYEVDSAGAYSVLYAFDGGTSPVFPYAGLLRNSAGNLFGTTTQGGEHYRGAIYEINTAGQETTLYSFTGNADGNAPYAGLIRDSEGNLYGTTAFGGAAGFGVVFKLDATGVLTVRKAVSMELRPTVA